MANTIICKQQKGGAAATKKRIVRKHAVKRRGAKLAAAAAGLLLVKLIAGTGGERAAETALRGIAESGDAVTEILTMELGGGHRADAMSVMSGQSTILDEITHLTVADEPDDSGEVCESLPPVNIIYPTVRKAEAASGDYYEYSLSGKGIKIKNVTGYEIDPSALMSEDLNIHINGDSPQVLIIHTHGSEAYKPDGDDIYEASDPSRTEDKRYNVIRIGDELCDMLTARGISVLHDRELYDYPTYTGSYNRSMGAIEKYLEQYPDIKVVLDVHRDAIEDSAGNAQRTYATFGDETCSQILLICGTDAGGLEHPNWRENLKFALHLQADMDEKYPGLTRPLKLTTYRYNQQATTGSLIVEVGCTGNTLQESIGGATRFCDCLGDVLLRFSEELGVRS